MLLAYKNIMDFRGGFLITPERALFLLDSYGFFFETFKEYNYPVDFVEDSRFLETLQSRLFYLLKPGYRFKEHNEITECPPEPKTREGFLCIEDYILRSLGWEPLVQPWVKKSPLYYSTLLKLKFEKWPYRKSASIFDDLMSAKFMRKETFSELPFVSWSESDNNLPFYMGSEITVEYLKGHLLFNYYGIPPEQEVYNYN